MALLNILRYPDPRLYKRAAPVLEVDESVRALVRNMAETMYSAPGMGLAATQVDVHKRVIVSSEGVQYREEGCLSVPGIYEPVERAEQVTVRALGLDGRSLTIVAEELL